MGRTYQWDRRHVKKTDCQERLLIWQLRGFLEAYSEKRGSVPSVKIGTDAEAVFNPASIVANGLGERNALA